jgi:hypothetical protein
VFWVPTIFCRLTWSRWSVTVPFLFSTAASELCTRAQTIPPKSYSGASVIRRDLIEEIHETGFLPTAPATSEIKWRGIPVCWTTILFFILIWNGLFLLDRAVSRRFMDWPGLFALVPLFLAFSICWGTKVSPRLQKMILRDGHSVNEIKAHLSLIQTVSGILLIIFMVLVFSHSFG